LDTDKFNTAIACIEKRVASAQNEQMSPVVQRVRNELLSDCNQASQHKRGFFSLTAPTGSGKTVSMMSFALRHAQKHQMKRIIMAVPFLSIIDQNAKDYEDIFKDTLGYDFVLQHHSLAVPRSGDANISGNYFIENWNAEVIVTTNVQLLESLFSNIPSACRKLHRIANSVILMDEIQSLPADLIVPTIATLDCLIKDYGCSVVFSTATQPAYDVLVKELAMLGVTNYKATEIVHNSKKMFADMARVEYTFVDEPMTWNGVATALAKRNQVLCVVNRKKDVNALYNELLEMGIADEDVFCLSTNLCPQHRMQILEAAQKRLNLGQRCILISTQCIEAGVNISFPSVWRAISPWEAILQAGGRGNRHGLMEKKGEVVIFKPAKVWNNRWGYPDMAYYSATMTALGLLTRKCDLNDPSVTRKYYSLFYNRSGIASSTMDCFQGFAQSRDFANMKKQYRLIEEKQIRVLVPYDLTKFERLKENLQLEMNSQWVREAQMMMVNTHQPKPGDVFESCITPVILRDGTPSDEYYILTDLKRYNNRLGLLT
jgi:CRISPR-associated helicase Cas3